MEKRVTVQTHILQKPYLILTNISCTHSAWTALVCNNYSCAEKFYYSPTSIPHSSLLFNVICFSSLWNASFVRPSFSSLPRYVIAPFWSWISNSIKILRKPKQKHCIQDQTMCLLFWNYFFQIGFNRKNMRENFNLFWHQCTFSFWFWILKD